MNYKLTFIGFGNVAQALIHLLERKRATLKDQYDITFSVTGIATGKHGFAVNPNGLDIVKALSLIKSGQSVAKFFVNARERFVVGHQRIQSGCNV